MSEKKQFTPGQAVTFKVMGGAGTEYTGTFKKIVKGVKGDWAVCEANGREYKTRPALVKAA
jgi:hypothetical protein